MTGKGYKQLKIDNDFKNLIRPLRRDEHAQLEANIILDGCRDPIIAWKGIIIDGHNRYEICNRLHIPYTVQEIEFNGREEAVIWICVNQLGRRSITEETRKYLIGRQYEAEKIIGFRRNANGHNQYTKSTDSDLPDISDKTNDTESKESSRRTANRIGSKYNISSGSVQKYAIYSNAIDTLGKKMPELVPKVLSGNYKISHENIVALSKMGAKEAKELNTKIRQGTAPFTRYSESRRDLPGSLLKKPGPKPAPKPAIKSMPEYDPDGPAKALALTIPSWASSIERTMTLSDLNLISSEAKQELKKALRLLRSNIRALLDAIKEDA